MKPGGLPRIIPELAPRGLIACFPFADASFTEIVTGMLPVTKGTTQKFSPCPYGFGGTFPQDNTSYLGYPLNPNWTLNTPFSLEAIVWITSVGSWSLAATDLFFIADNVDPNSTSAWSAGIGADAASTMAGSTSSGGKYTGAFTCTAKEYCHFVFTWTGGTQAFYANGKLVSSVAAATYTGGRQSLIAGCADVGTDQSIPGTYLLMNLAGAAWSAQEIAQRYHNPYNFLSFPGEFASSLLAHISSGGGAVNVSLVAATASGAVEALVPNVQPQLVAATATGAIEAFVAEVEPALTAATATGAIEAFSLQISPNISLVAATATGAVEALVPDVQPSLIAAAAAGALEAFVAEIEPTLSAATAVGAVEPLVPSVSITLSDAAATGAAGTFSVVVGINVNLVAATATAGDASFVPLVEPALVAAPATATAEALTATLSMAFATAAATVGHASFTPNVEPQLGAATATGAAEALVASIGTLVILAAAAAVAGEASFTVEIDVNINEASATAAVQSFVFSSGHGTVKVIKGLIVDLRNMMGR